MLSAVSRSAERAHDGPVVYEVNERYAFGLSDRVLVITWRRAPSVADFAEFDRLLVEQAARGRLSVLVVIEPQNTSPPSPHARAALASLIEQHTRDIAGIATVLLGTTIKHSMLRFVLSTMQLMAPSAVPQSTFDAVESAARWLRDHAPEVDPAKLARDCHYLRSLEDPIL
jgi:hypothetical protein